MTDTQRKTVTLAGKHMLAPNRPALGVVRGGYPMSWVPTSQILRAQDTPHKSARTLVAEIHVDGALTWIVDASTDPDAAGQYYPDTTTWRKIANTINTKLTPGCYLEAHVTFTPSGMTEEQDGGANWIGAGTQGAIRLGVTWSNGLSTTGPHYHSTTLPGAKGTWGALPTTDGADWTQLDERLIEEIWPPSVDSDESESQKYSEFTDAAITVEIQGGARPHSIVIYEKPFAHTQDHDETAEQSAHAYVISGQIPSQIDITAAPLEEAADGATYEENRFGSHQMIRAASVQTQKFGPQLFAWTAWQSDPADILDTDHDQVQITVATFQDVFDTSITSWAAENPGLIVSCPYSLIHEWNDDEYILRGRAAVIPVEIKLRATWADQGGGEGVRIRFQSSAVSWIDCIITDATPTENTFWGFLEAQVYGDQAVANLQVFARASTGDADLYTFSGRVWNP